MSTMTPVAGGGSTPCSEVKHHCRVLSNESSHGRTQGQPFSEKIVPGDTDGEGDGVPETVGAGVVDGDAPGDRDAVGVTVAVGVWEGDDEVVAEVDGVGVEDELADGLGLVASCLGIPSACLGCALALLPRGMDENATNKHKNGARCTLMACLAMLQRERAPRGARNVAVLPIGSLG